MQAVSKVVTWQLDFLSCDSDSTFIDAVGVSADGCAEITGVVDSVCILSNVVIS